MSTGSTARPRSRSSKNRSSSRRTTAPGVGSSPQTQNANYNDHQAIDRVLAGYLRTHPQATLGTTPIIDVMVWSQSRFKVQAPAATETTATDTAPANTQNNRTSKPRANAASQGVTQT